MPAAGFNVKGFVKGIFFDGFSFQWINRFPLGICSCLPCWLSAKGRAKADSYLKSCAVMHILVSALPRRALFLFWIMQRKNILLICMTLALNHDVFSSPFSTFMAWLLQLQFPFPSKVSWVKTPPSRCSAHSQHREIICSKPSAQQKVGMHKLLAPPIGEKGKLYRICGLV